VRLVQTADADLDGLEALGSIAEDLVGQQAVVDGF
jgi:hypothetical protein